MIRSLFTLSLCLIVSGWAGAREPVPWVPFAICDTRDPAEFPEVHGDHVVWETLTRWSDWDVQGADLNNVDVDAIEILTIGGSPQNEWRADVYGSTVVYERQFLGAEDADILYTRSFSDYPEEIVIDESYARSMRPRVWGNRVTWMHLPVGVSNWDVMVANLEVGGFAPMALSTTASEIFPDVHDNTLVWAHVIDKSSGILSHSDVNAMDPNQVHSGMELNPNHPVAICGDWVVGVDPDGWVWADNTMDANDPRRISRSDACGGVTIADHIVVWHDFRNRRWDLYGYNLETQKEFVIVKRSYDDQLHPSISACPDGDGYWIVWDDNRDGTVDVDIYGMKINGPKVATLESVISEDEQPAVD